MLKLKREIDVVLNDFGVRRPPVILPVLVVCLSIFAGILISDVLYAHIPHYHGVIQTIQDNVAK